MYPSRINGSHPINNANAFPPRDKIIFPINKRVNDPNREGHIFIQNILPPNKFVIHANTLSKGGTSIKPHDIW
jgi:hypothetical protein